MGIVGIGKGSETGNGSAFGSTGITEGTGGKSDIGIGSSTSGE